MRPAGFAGPPATLSSGPWEVQRVTRRDVDLESLRGQKPSLEHGPEPVAVGTVLVDGDDGDRVLAAYLPHDPVEDRTLRRLALAAKVPVQDRTGGLKVRNLTFGSIPRLEVRSRDACTAAGLNRDYPELYAALAAQARPLEDLYETVAPGVFDGHQAKAETIERDWHLRDSRVFTGGVLNRDSNLGYHHDTGNFADVFSAMIGLRHAMDGGELVLPEFGLHFPVADKTASFFDGQAALHGVTDLRPRSVKQGYRFTIVYYSTARLWKCLPPSDEAYRARTVKTDRAIKRAEGDRG